MEDDERKHFLEQGSRAEKPDQAENDDEIFYRTKPSDFGGLTGLYFDKKSLFQC
jgi:hypothetical protein